MVELVIAMDVCQKFLCFVCHEVCFVDVEKIKVAGGRDVVYMSLCKSYLKNAVLAQPTSIFYCSAFRTADNPKIKN